ncbi:hypothetical protein A4A49_15406 [Nicotiana attenuata]|uniref:Uncharacterized protein n=1 Tax=Nicotiana attenuata TaxID=49451 RepID=A0A1J6IJQ3_NICAT|nr:hypothetical protein A4A49_15406 [Nicotiana attenuata]
MFAGIGAYFSYSDHKFKIIKCDIAYFHVGNMRRKLAAKKHIPFDKAFTAFKQGRKCRKRSIAKRKRTKSHQSVSVKKNKPKSRLVDEDIPVSKKSVSRKLALEGIDEEEEEDLDINAAQTQIEEQVSETIIVEEEKDSDDEALVLLARDNIARVDKKWIRMANNLEFFMKNSWSKECFELTIEYLNKDMLPRYKSYVRKRKENNISGKKSKSASYVMYGFPWTFMEVHPYLIPTLREMDMDYMKNLVPYDDEVADPTIDQLAVDLESVNAIKKAPGAASLETNDEDDIVDDDPLGGSFATSWWFFFILVEEDHAGCAILSQVIQTCAKS